MVAIVNYARRLNLADRITTAIPREIECRDNNGPPYAMDSIGSAMLVLPVRFYYRLNGHGLLLCSPDANYPSPFQLMLSNGKAGLGLGASWQHTGRTYGGQYGWHSNLKPAS